MADNTGLQLLQHLELQVVVVLVQLLLGAGGVGRPAGVAREAEHAGVEVDGDAVDVVNGADEVVDGRVLGEDADARRERWPDELGLEADEDVDLRGVGLLQALRFDEVGFMTGREDGEGGGRVVELRCVRRIYIYIYMCR